MLHKGFGSLTAAKSFVADNGIALGKVSSLDATGPLKVTVTLQASLTSAGSGLILGVLHSSSSVMA